MTFQFLCPQGHLLEGDPSQAGQTCQCPTCGTGFVIPAPVESAAAPAGNDAGFAGIRTAPDFVAGGAQPAGEEAVPDFGAPPSPDDADRVIRIICPNGHELETPMDMVGTDAMCPECNAQFRLRYEDSLEYRQQREEERERREARRAKKALNWAIFIAVAVIVMLGVLMIIYASS